MTRACPRCDAPIQTRPRGRKREYCSSRCAKAAWFARTFPRVAAPCPGCGGAISNVARGRRRVWCSVACRTKEIPASDVAPVKPRKTVATVRVAHGMRTQWEVAQLLGVTHQAIQNIEERALRKLLRLSAAERAYRESEGQADRAGASLPGGMEDE